jgi:hypothetical protein
LSHTARFSRFAKLLYPYHPLFDNGPEPLEVIEVRIDMLVMQLPDGTRRGIPAWMFDEQVCATMSESPYPIVEVASLLEIVKLLEVSGLGIRSARDERKSPSEQSCTEKVATQTSNTSTRKFRNRQKDPRRKKARVHRVDTRVNRSAGHSSKQRRVR